MKEVLIHGITLPEAYHQSLYMLNSYGEYSACPDYNTNQIEVSMTMEILHPLQEPMISKCIIGGAKELEQYQQEILDGILDFEVEKGNWAYTYHSRMEKQFDFIINELRRNPDSRRAVIDVRDWEVDSKNNDPACMQHVHYFIRDRALHCKVLFRSNDACKATFFNAFAMIMLQKKFADELGVGVGSYTHRANSYHCYEKDFGLLKGYVSRILNNEELTYDYAGDWDELMQESQLEIAKSINQLKGR